MFGAVLCSKCMWTQWHFNTFSAWVVLSCISYQTRSPVFFWYATPHHVIVCFVMKCSRLLVKAYCHQVVWSTQVLYYDLLRSQVRFIQVPTEMVSQMCCFPIPWITSSGFSWITSRHNQSLLSWKKRLTKPSFVFMGVTHGDAVMQVDSVGLVKRWHHI